MMTSRPQPLPGTEPWACPRCGALMTEPGACCSGCAAAAGCALVRCGHCGHEFPHPQRSPWAYRLSRWWHRARGTYARRQP